MWSKSWGRRKQQNELTHPFTHPPTHRLSCRACLSPSITVRALGRESRSCKTRLNSPSSPTFPSPSWLQFKLHHRSETTGLSRDPLPLLTTGLDSPLDHYENWKLGHWSNPKHTITKDHIISWAWYTNTQREHVGAANCSFYRGHQRLN